jgi:TRAP-type C4-dicarboxylate transport system permease small subunit
MSTEILHADRRLRRVTFVVLMLSVLAAAALVFASHAWLTRLANTLTTAQLIEQIRRGIGLAVIACGGCLLLLAGYSARMARRVKNERRWPLSDARVLRDTPIRRDLAATRIARLLDVVTFALVLFAIATIVLAWRLFAVR